MTLVVGVDPGNVSSGISYWYEGKLLAHETFRPWDDSLSAPTGLFVERVHLFVEVSAHGTKKTREGIQWAGGMIARELIRAGFDVVRSRTSKVPPRWWRELIMPGVPADIKGWTKAECLAEAAHWALRPVDSEDEAEAILIGAAGCMARGVTPVGRRK